jgi:cytochrome c553
MTQLLKWISAGIAGLAGSVLLAMGFAWLYSESVIERHYPLLSMDVPPANTPDVPARGLHLAKLTGCFGCHGKSLHGLALKPLPHVRIYAPNLTRSAQVLNDEQFARAIRDGLKPDGTSLWIMPSEDYVYMSNGDIAALVAYVHTLPAAGNQTPPPKFTRHARIAILKGELEPTAMRIAEAGASLDLGPRYQGGRYIARISCASCHGLDLSGTPDGRVPSLTVMSRYSLRDFFALLHDGRAGDRHPLPTMSYLARSRFSDFKDYETMALYDYLSARAAALPHE